MLEICILSLTEVADALRRYREGIEVNPARLSEVEQRLAALERLNYKYNINLRESLDIQGELSKRLCGLTNLSVREQSL
jgi:DNA repair protein RecN (Recombination protein N)